MRRQPRLAALVAACLIAGCALAATPAVSVASVPQPERPRVFVLTDIENEPDDTQSLVRLLLYANDLDLRGLVATTSVHMKQGTHAESIRRVIARYDQVLPRLRRHDAGYPDAAQLLARVADGQPGYGIGATGAGRDSAGAAVLLRELERDDPRPMWVSVWGGANTLAQALFTLRQTRTPQAVERAVSRLRVYTISDQDDAGAWLRREFPGLFYIVSPGGYGNATWGGMNQVVDGIDNSPVSNAWIARHIQQGHGPLGAAYPDVAYGMEGDTPSFLGLIPNGLNVPERPDWGGWGGRYERYTPRRENTDPTGFNGGVPIEQETRPIWTNAVDRFKPYVPAPYGRSVKPAEREFSGNSVTVWRWREAVQNDFAARMLWTTQEPSQANHAPVVKLAHAAELSVRSGEWLQLDASPSTDPDGDNLSFLWFTYPEAGTLKVPLVLGTENIAWARFYVPKVDAPATAHVIVQVTDKGSPALTRYRRVILNIRP
ncbi:nucleoside hydrolase-like domain-containing protein [Roseateles sp. DC23W]|uniref:Nucleoside hydrolase-like domain-containing protein n=1 Tax=Pelomonas dachongensis TaxID=3299029 RepID=A0ABW7ERL7_9BURK